MVRVLPSLLAADFLNLSKDIDRMEQAGADAFHLDVMDGQFVPNISYGMPLIRAIRLGTALPLDVHLMTENPEQFIDDYADIGVDMLSFHIEATHHAHRLIAKIQEKGMKAGIALNPQTPIESVQHLLDDIDFILIMTVNPGFGGQSFIDNCLDKVHMLSQYREAHNLSFDIEVDGGINQDTAKKCIKSGADLLVSGSYLFKADELAEAVREMRHHNES